MKTWPNWITQWLQYFVWLQNQAKASRLFLVFFNTTFDAILIQIVKGKGERKITFNKKFK